MFLRIYILFVRWACAPIFNQNILCLSHSDFKCDNRCCLDRKMYSNNRFCFGVKSFHSTSFRIDRKRLSTSAKYRRCSRQGDAFSGRYTTEPEVITSSPEPIPKAFRIRKSESVPFPVPMQWICFAQLCEFCFKFPYRFASMNWWLCKTSLPPDRSLACNSYCGRRLTNGITIFVLSMGDSRHQGRNFLISDFVYGLNGGTSFFSNQNPVPSKNLFVTLCGDRWTHRWTLFRDLPWLTNDNVFSPRLSDRQERLL